MECSDTRWVIIILGICCLMSFASKELIANTDTSGKPHVRNVVLSSRITNIPAAENGIFVYFSQVVQQYLAFSNVSNISVYFQNCKSQLCSLFHEQTCSRFTRLFVRRSSPCPKYLINPFNAIFLKSQGSKDIKHHILDCQIHKYTNANAQIYKYKFTKTQIYKYTNTAYDK